MPHAFEPLTLRYCTAIAPTATTGVASCKMQRGEAGGSSRIDGFGGSARIDRSGFSIKTIFAKRNYGNSPCHHSRLKKGGHMNPGCHLRRYIGFQRHARGTSQGILSRVRGVSGRIHSGDRADILSGISVNQSRVQLSNTRLRAVGH